MNVKYTQTQIINTLPLYTPTPTYTYTLTYTPIPPTGTFSPSPTLSNTPMPTGTPPFTGTPFPTGTPEFTGTAFPTGTAVAFATAQATPTVTLSQTPFAATRHSAVIAATASEAWVDTWTCGGNSYSYTISGTFAANGVAYAVYGFNGPTAPSAGATNGVLLTGPVTLSGASYVAVDPKFRFAAMRLQDFSGATTVTVNDFCNNFNNRQ